jgi:hypothetical protein
MAIEAASSWVSLFRHCLFCQGDCGEAQCAEGRALSSSLVAKVVQPRGSGAQCALSELFLHYVECQVGAAWDAAVAAQQLLS